MSSEQEINIGLLLNKYDKGAVIGIRKLTFLGVDKKDVYNITSPFKVNGREYIAGRVEARENENSQIMFFAKGENGDYLLDETAPALGLQDPFITLIGTQILVGGVEFSIEQHRYRTVFYLGTDIKSLQRYAEGPDGMKDLRLVALPGGKIGIFTRPQGRIGGRGRIGFTMIDAISDLPGLTSEDYFSAPLIPGKYSDDEWMGANAIYLLNNGCIGVLGHIASLSENSSKNYYPIAFCFSYPDKTVSGIKIIATRNELPPGESKSESLRNVLFGGGLVRNNDGTARLYTGVGDAEAYEITIRDPFIELEAQVQAPGMASENEQAQGKG